MMDKITDDFLMYILQEILNVGYILQDFSNNIMVDGSHDTPYLPDTGTDWLSTFFPGSSPPDPPGKILTAGNSFHYCITKN